ncbi:MAG: hypothetical protein M3071_10290 [Actinomycetota bacterium]|nr:hypothetical protein [Actinomycetota bacterium]
MLLTGLATAIAVLLASGSAAQAATIWTPINSGTTDTISAIVYQSPARFWYATTNGKLEYYNGSAFVAGAGPSPGTIFTDLAFQPGTTGGPGTAGLYGYAVASDGQIWQTADGGVTWTSIAKPSTYPDCSSTTFAPESELNGVVWAGSSTAYMFGNNSTVLKATNANTASPGFAEINKNHSGTCADESNSAVTNLTDGVFLASNPLAGFMVSQDFGQIYSTSNGFSSGVRLSQMINEFTGNPRMAQDAANPNRIWVADHAAGGGGCGSLCFGLSTDGGVTFSNPKYPQYLNSGTSPTIGLYDVSSQGGTEVAAGTGGEIFNSVDGTNFYNQPATGALATENWRAEDAYDSAHAAVGGVGGALVITAQANTIPDITAPTGTIVGPTTVPSGSAVTFSANVADNAGGSGINPAGYTWTVPGFPAQHGSSATYAFPRGTGSARITLSFTDNAGNQGTATLDVTVTDAPVVPAVSIGGTGTSNGTTLTITVSCASTPCTVTVTITGSSTSHATRGVSARKKKAKAVTIATGTFTIKKTGQAKLAVKLTKTGKRLLKKSHGHLNAKAVVSTTINGQAQKVSKTIHITTKKK